MKAVSFPQANRVLKAPPSERSRALETIAAAELAGVDVTGAREKVDAAFPPEQEVYDLPVWGGEVEGVPRCISCWEPSPEERALIAAGGPVWLWVVGHTHPPLVLDAQSPFEVQAFPPDNFRDWWLQNGAGIISGLRETGADTGDAEAVALAVYLRLVPPAIMAKQRPTVAESFQELLARLTLTEEEERTVETARIGASHEIDTLLAIIDRLTGKTAEEKA